MSYIEALATTVSEVAVTALENIEKTNTEKIDAADCDITCNDKYDGFSEKHSAFTTAIHKKLTAITIYRRFDLPSSEALDCNAYRSRSECDTARKKCLKTAYNAANRYVTAGEDTSIATFAANQYNEVILSCFVPILDDLKLYCHANNKEIIFNNILTLITGSQNALQTRFDKELTLNADYYTLYNFDYFLDQVSIEKQDYRVSENPIMRLLEAAAPGYIEYTFEDAYSAILEMEKDLNKHCATFFNQAFSEYKNYIAKIEQLLDVIGKDFIDFSEDDDINAYLKNRYKK